MKDEIRIFPSRHFESFSADGISVESIGEKGIGLFDCDQHLVPPYIVISSNLFSLWFINETKACNRLGKVIENCNLLLKEHKISSLIIRSSAKFESFQERGHYQSLIEISTDENLYDSVIKILRENKSRVIDSGKENKFAIIVQQYIKPKTFGHLSNGRRVSRSNNNWHWEEMNEKGIFVKGGKKNVTKKEININLDYDIFRKLSMLKALAVKISRDRTRYHIEWVWDNVRFWVVQWDKERVIENEDFPGSEWKRDDFINERISAKLFITDINQSKPWKKIECLKTFKDCNLPTGVVYLLENNKIIESLNKGILTTKLAEDLTALLKYPIVIRTDIKQGIDSEGLMLPRTETLFDVNSVYAFLIKNAKSFIEKGLKSDEFCFILHRFIISKSCALAFSKPGLPRVRIDSTWGIVDGLYYHPHDSFEVNLVEASIKKKIRCKSEYLDFSIDGKWISKSANSKLDWAESLNRRQLKEIANYTNNISNHLGLPVTVMYFVDVNKTTGYPDILPWFYTTEDIPESSEKFTDAIFSEKRVFLTSREDFQAIQSKLETTEINEKVSIQLRLTPDLLREREFIEEIGKFAHANNILIELHGSILSHTYYILKKAEARVKCIDVFEPKHKKQYFYKLVRDKIPFNIQSKGESVGVVKIETDKLLRFLRVKAVEEAFELFWEKNEDKTIEELADLFEVVRSICKIYNIPLTELERIADDKSEKKGSFEKGVLLIETATESLINIYKNIDIPSLKLEQDKSPDNSYVVRNRFNPNKLLITKDNTISIPYVIDYDQEVNEGKRYSLSVNNTDIEIRYNSKGILIKLGRENKKGNSNQLSLFEDME